MKIKTLINYLERIAPPGYQESYDNAGLLVGDASQEIKGVLICLDSTEQVIEEAVKKQCNLIIAHHPIIFKGLKRITGNSYVERVVMEAIRFDIAIYAIHTNLDNVYNNGVNLKIGQKLGLNNLRILAPKAKLKKLFTFVPATHSEQLRLALFEAGGGEVAGFEHLSYATVGIGTQNGGGNAEMKLELLFPEDRERDIIQTLQQVHPGVRVPYDIIPVENISGAVGAGMVGELKKPMAEKAFLKKLKEVMKTGCIRYTRLRRKPVKRVAVCGGAGSFLLPRALASKADVFVTADFKYHEFFDAEGQIVIADIGHYESEQFTIELLYELISNKFSNFAAYCTKVNTNPVKYL